MKHIDLYQVWRKGNEGHMVMDHRHDHEGRKYKLVSFDTANSLWLSAVEVMRDFKPNKSDLGGLL